MKKLLTTMSVVAAAMSLYATDAGALSGTSFEGLAAADQNPYNITAPEGEITGTGGFWRTNGTDTLTVKAGESVAPAQTDLRPKAFQGTANANYLSIKTASLNESISRRVNADGSAVSIDGGTETTKGLYFDSYVRFTAFDGDQTIDLGEGGKLAIWLKEEELDGGSTSTNLMITAGYLDSSLQARVVTTNYNCEVVGGINFNDGGWHRVTVKAIDSIYASGSATPGFVVFVDKSYVRTTDTTTMGISGTLTGTASEWNRLKALFPSACQNGTAVGSITAVDFAGQGDVDELVFTRTAPFDDAQDIGLFTIVVPVTGVESVTFTTNNVDVVITETTTLAITDALSRYGIKISAEYSDGYMGDTWEGLTIDGGSYYPQNDGDYVGIVTKRAGAYVGNTPFPTLAAAVAHVNDTTECPAGSGTYTIRLADDATLTETMQFTNTGITNVLDLAGKTIIGAAEADVIEVAANAALTIIDSDDDDGGTISAGTEGTVVKTKNGSMLIITDGTFNGQFALRDNTASLTAGSYSYADNTDGDAFALRDFVAAGKFAEHVDAYWVIGDAPTYTITFDAGTATVDPATTNYTMASGEITLPEAVPTSLGVTYGGWTNATYTTAIKTYTPAAGDGSFTLYVKWDPVAPSTLTLVSGDNSTVDPSSYSFFAGGAAIALPTPTLNSGVIGVTFGGWTNETITTATMTFTPPAEAGDVTLYAKWDAVAPCTIMFETGRADATVDPASTNFWAGQATITLPTPVLDPQTVGVTFGGWTNETITTAITEYTPPAENAESFTLYAKWDAVVVNYPTYIDSEDTKIVNQYNDWKQAYGADTESAYETEFLLNVAPDATDKTLDTTAVSISGTTVTINIDHGNLNGYPYVKKAATLAGLKTATPEAITVVPADGNNKENGLDNGGRVTIENQSGASMFYQIGVQATPVAVPNNNAD